VLTGRSAPGQGKIAVTKQDTGRLQEILGSSDIGIYALRIPKQERSSHARSDTRDPVFLTVEVPRFSLPRRVPDCNGKHWRNDEEDQQLHCARQPWISPDSYQAKSNKEDEQKTRKLAVVRGYRRARSARHGYPAIMDSLDILEHYEIRKSAT
jgi:hypothetical protein